MRKQQEEDKTHEQKSEMIALKNISRLIVNYNKHNIKIHDKKMDFIQKWYRIQSFTNKMYDLNKYLLVKRF